MMLQVPHAAVCNMSLFYVFFGGKKDKVNTNKELWLHLHMLCVCFIYQDISVKFGISTYIKS